MRALIVYNSESGTMRRLPMQNTKVKTVKRVEEVTENDSLENYDAIFC